MGFMLTFFSLDDFGQDDSKDRVGRIVLSTQVHSKELHQAHSVDGSPRFLKE
jgi:hypothetical protein